MARWGKMNDNKRRGSDFERQVMKALQARGYYVMRSAGSHEIVDIVAIGSPRRFGAITCVLFIQCKRGGAISPADWNELFSTASSYRARPLIVQVGQRGKGPLFSEILCPKIKPLDSRRYTEGGEKEIFVP
jgi:Holliday junction resolvase